jgi:site-specific recombinase XerD
MKLQLTLSQAIEGFLLEKEAQRLSPHTIADYRNAFRKLQSFLGDDPLIDDITAGQIRQCLAGLGTEPQPMGGAAPRSPKPLSKKTIYNIHTALSSLWTWAVREGIADQHVVHNTPRPRPEKRAIQPFTQADVRAMLDVCDRTARYTRPGKRACSNERPTALRDRAIILLLLDTGMRASELAGLRIQHVDLRQHHLRVFGKGSKERILPISVATARALWKYLATRPDDALGDALFLTHRGRPYGRGALLKLIRSLGDSAGVPNAHPHRFRHTFAINYLRNGGDAYTLQMLLGHSTMEMVKTYLQLAHADAAKAHQRASPVANWDL